MCECLGRAAEVGKVTTLWRATPLARAHFGRGTVWYRSEDSARQAVSAFSEALSDPVGLFVAEVEPEYVVDVPGGRSLPSHQSMAYADKLIAEAAGHRWLALWDGPQPGGPWEVWVRLAGDEVEVRPVAEDDPWTVPTGW